MPRFRPHEKYKDLKRYSHIAAVLVHHGFQDVLDKLTARYHVTPRALSFLKKRVSEGLSTAEHLRLAFEELGPTFIKFGQILSSRPDILPPEFVEELSKLQDDVPPFPFEDARALVEAELGRPLAELFLSIEEKPTAAASLAQVHRARTVTGDRVAIKIQRVGVKEIIEVDIRILRELAKMAERHIPESRYFEPVRVVDRFARTIRQELDFVREGRNIDRFRKHFSGTPIVYIPRVYWELTSPKVLTTEFVEGIKISDLDLLEAAGLDRKTIAVNGANITLKEIFEFHFFHADPHPGNLFVLEDNVIAPVDFGMTGAIDEETAGEMSGIFMAVMDKDVEALVDFLRKTGVIEELEDYRDFKIELRDMFERYYGVPLSQLDIKTTVGELMDIIHRYRLRLPADFFLIAKAILISEGVGRMLYPEFTLIEIARPYARRLLLQRFDPARQLRELSKAGREAYAFLKVLPSDMREIFSMIRKGTIAIKFDHRGLELLVDQLDRSSNRLSSAMVIAALIVGSSLIFQTGLGPKLFGYPILGLGGFLLASILGIWLLISIMRSKRL